MELYHGTDVIIYSNNIDLGRSRSNLDFEKGFYLSDKKELAKIWSSKYNFKNHIVNIYNLNKKGLKECNLGFDIKWLIFVMYNRFKNNRNYKKYMNIIYEKIKDDFDSIENSDLIVGPIIDSGFHNIIEAVLNGYIESDEAIKLLTLYTKELQYVLKNKKSIESLKFVGHDNISSDDAEKFRRDGSRIELYKITSKYINDAMDKKDKTGYIPNKEKVIEKLLDEYKLWKEVNVNA